ncbi:MAG: SUMF1/EgtB/PvdO family nonheme iron enzyme [Opitutaceae bacterium]
MSPAEAAKLLELPESATPEQIEARFHELRTKLEDKIAKAPTPGLKAKYRESLEEITTAFETLTVAADSSALPVLKKQAAPSEQPAAASSAPAGGEMPPSHETQSSTAKPKVKSGGKEFIIVAVIAVAVLAGGGWWVMKTKAENAEKARLAAVAKAEAERLAEDKKRAEDEEKARLVAEQERLDKLAATTRAKIAELRIAWEALEQEARALERRLSDLKAEERNLANNLKGGTSPDLLQTRADLAAHEELYNWLHQQLLRHPAKVARVQGEELLSAKQVDEAVSTITRAAEEQLRLENEFAANRKSMLTLTGEVSIKAGIQGVKWSLTDAYGRIHTGEGTLTSRSLPIGPLRAEFTRNSFKSRTQQVVVRRGQTLTLDPGFVPAKVTIESHPSGAEVWLDNSRLGVTPLLNHNFSPGEFRLELRLPDYPSKSVTFKVDENTFHRDRVILLRPDSGVPGFAYEMGQGIGSEKSYTWIEVKSVIPGSPAARAGIKPGDYIYEIAPPTGPAIIVDDMWEWNDDFDVHAVLSGRPGDVFKVKIGGAWIDGEAHPPTREVSFALMAQRDAMQPRPGEAFENTLGMKFVPVPGAKVLFSIWETRVQDFAAFVKATGHDATGGMWSLRRGVFAQHGDTWRQPGYRQEPDHPVVGVNHADAVAFCRWLTETERAAGRLGLNQAYRLPTDAEWSQAVGPDTYPWGNQWPPPPNAGNYAGNEARDADWADWLTLPGHADNFARTAPVGSFPANRHGLFDLGGNVLERVADSTEITRGASFNFGHDQASTATDKRANAASRGFSIGFRVVIAVE